MSHRLQVLISPQLDARLQKAAQRKRISKGEPHADPVARLGSLRAPATNIKRMLAEIEAGRS
jgi:hypothetical protein